MKKYPVLLVFGLALMNVATVHAGSNSGLVNASALPWVHPASAIIHMLDDHHTVVTRRWSNVERLVGTERATNAYPVIMRAGPSNDCAGRASFDPRSHTLAHSNLRVI